MGRGYIIEGETRGESLVDKCLVRKPRLMLSRREPKSKQGG